MSTSDCDRLYQEVKFREKALRYSLRVAQNCEDLNYISTQFYNFFTANFDTPHQNNLAVECLVRSKAFDLVIGFGNHTSLNSLLVNAQKVYDFIIQNDLFDYVYNPHIRMGNKI